MDEVGDVRNAISRSRFSGPTENRRRRCDDDYDHSYRESDDALAAASVVERAFKRIDEARLVTLLRADGDSVVSLVSAVEDLVVGHVMFSRIAAPFRALALGLRCQGLSTEQTRAAIDWNGC
jgi:hypothetical protein